MDVQGTTAWVCEPAAVSWADDNCGHELQAVVYMPHGVSSSSVSSSLDRAVELVGDGSPSPYAFPPAAHEPGMMAPGVGEACDVLGSSIAAAGARGAIHAKDALLRPLAEFATLVEAVVDAVKKCGAQMGEGGGGSGAAGAGSGISPLKQTVRNALAGLESASPERGALAGGAVGARGSSAAGATRSGTKGDATERELLEQLTGELMRLRQDFARLEGRASSGGDGRASVESVASAPLTQRAAALLADAPTRMPSASNHHGLGRPPSPQSQCRGGTQQAVQAALPLAHPASQLPTRALGAVGAAGVAGEVDAHWPARMLELDEVVA